MVDATQQSNEAVASKARENMQWLLTTFSSAFQDTIILTIATKVNSEGAIDIRTLGQQWAEDTSLYAALSAHHWRLFACDASNEASLDAVLAYLHDKLERKKSLLGSPTTTATSTATATTSSTATSTPRPSVGAPSTISTTTSHNDLPPQATMPVTPWEHVPNPTHLSDTEFYAWFLARKQFLYFDHQCLLRTVFLTLQQEKRDLRPFLDHLCAILQAIVLLEQNPLKPSSPSSFSFSFSSLPKKTPMHPFIVYSETQALFWVQMTAYALLRCPLLEDKKTFDVFLRKCPELWNEEAWKMYYSPKVYLSSKAAQAFLPPDCKPLPNAFKPSALALKGNGLRIEYQVL
ncbi:hypothetical protein BDF14DRAFT_40584 [Spinellus fusiger]|nr:hypothetical protein BDF14DRAFT_40584 [Spinellus fusiger]